MSGSRQLRIYLFLRDQQDWPVERAAEEAGLSLAEARLTEADRERGMLDGIEPLDPATPAPGHNEPPEEVSMSEGSVAADELRLLIERIERLEEEKKGIADDVRDVYAEAKARGYDTRTMRECVKLRKLERQVREEREALLETYKAALGMDYSETPLGRATVHEAMKKTVEAINDGALGPNVSASFHPAH